MVPMFWINDYKINTTLRCSDRVWFIGPGPSTMNNYTTEIFLTFSLRESNPQKFPSIRKVVHSAGKVKSS